MSESIQAAGSAKEQTQTEVKRITSNIRDLGVGAAELASRLSSLKYRLQGIQDDAEVASDAPEPVRNDLEELDYQLSLIRNNFNQIDIHIGHLERI
jgi:chromosome segregation ATPase